MAYLDRWFPITVVRGLQGFGKSTLVTTWLLDQADELRWIWASARSHRDDSAAFGRQLLRELGDDALEDADPIAALDQVAFRRRGQRLVLIVDDAHLLQDDPLLRRLIDLVARHQHLHMVLCSRGPHRVEELAAGRVDLLVVPGHTLLLNVEEIVELAALMDVSLPLEQARRLHAAFRGWPAAVRLVIGNLAAPADELPLAVAEHYVRDAVIPGISDQQTLHEVTRFALAERLTHRLIRDLSHGHDARALIRALELTGVAERRYDGTDVVVEFPPFIQSILRDHIAEQDPEAARAMHGRLGHWFATHEGPNHALYALRHARSCEDWELFDRIWIGGATDLAFERPGALAKVLGGIPDSVIATRAGMTVAREAVLAGAAVRGRPGGQMDSVRAYAEASRRLAARGLESLALHDLLYIGTGSFVALRLEGRFGEADRAADRLEDLAAPRIGAGEETGDRLPWFNVQRGLTHTLRGNHPAAVHRYQLCWRSRRQTSPHVAAQAAANLALTHALAADPAGSRYWLDRHVELDTSRTWAREVVDQGAHLAAGFLALDRLDAARCAAELAHLGDGSEPLELWPYVTSLHAQHQLLFGSAAAGIGAIAAARARHSSQSSSGEAASPLLLRVQAELLLAIGQGQQARALLARHPGPPVPELAGVSARIALLAGDPLGACRLVSSHLWRDTTDNRARQDLLLVHAAASHRIGDLVTSAELTRQAVKLYEATGVLRSFAMFHADELGALLLNAEETLPADDLAVLQGYWSPFPASVELIELTRRERLLAEALVSNSSRQEIADMLYVSVNTVRSQLATLYRKLGVNRRELALTRLVELGLIEP